MLTPASQAERLFVQSLISFGKITIMTYNKQRRVCGLRL